MPVTSITPLDNSPQVRQILQIVHDLAKQPLSNLRILDLGCAHGTYALELARSGAQVLGIEARATWLEQAEQAKRRVGLNNVEFVQDDVRNLSKAKYGEFDIVLCLGLLYHLDAPDAFDFIAKIADVCRHVTVIETHFAIKPILSREWRGHHYWGSSVYEHAAGTSVEGKLKKLGASIDNEHSFWLTRPSLNNLLRHVGYSSVYACQNPLPNLYVGLEHTVKVWGNRITLAAIKGQPIHQLPLLNTTLQDEDWPENPATFSYEQHLHGQSLISRLHYWASLHLPTPVLRQLHSLRNKSTKD